jgi:hypothetical protein
VKAKYAKSTSAYIQLILPNIKIEPLPTLSETLDVHIGKYHSDILTFRICEKTFETLVNLHKMQEERSDTS